ncbi:MAG: FliM/FliN family flagellar motor switch protein [Geminicoccaceae bacterium]
MSERVSRSDQAAELGWTSVMPLDLQAPMAEAGGGDEIVLADAGIETTPATMRGHTSQHGAAPMRPEAMPPASAPSSRRGASVPSAGDLAVLRALMAPPAEAAEAPPGLAKLGERLAAMVAKQLARATGQEVQAQIQAARLETMRGHLATCLGSSVAIVLHFEAIEAIGLLRLDRPLLARLLTILLGGGELARAKPSERGLTVIEARLVERLAGQLLDGLAGLLPDTRLQRARLGAVETELRRVETDDSGEHHVVATIDVMLGNQRGACDLVLPPAILDLQGIAPAQQPERAAWAVDLAETAWQLEAELEAVLVERATTLGKVATWQPGDTIDLALTIDAPLDLRCRERTVATGIVGQREGRMVVTIDQGPADRSPAGRNDMP